MIRRAINLPAQTFPTTLPTLYPFLRQYVPSLPPSPLSSKDQEADEDVLSLSLAWSVWG